MSELLPFPGSSRGVARFTELLDKRVLITGAQRGIGAGITRAFAREGSRIVLQMPESCPTMHGLVAEIETLAEMRVFSCDPNGRPDAIQRLTRAAVAAFEGIDVVVNHMALSSNDLDCRDTGHDDAAVEARIVELLAMPCLVSSHAAGFMAEQRQGGVIINISTLEAGVLPEQLAFYGLVLSRLESMTRALATHWGSRGVRVHGLAPASGLYRTGGDLATSEIAPTALFLAGPRAEFLNGTLLAVDHANAGDTATVTAAQVAIA